MVNESDNKYVYYNNHILTDEEQDRLFPLTEAEKRVWQTWVPEGYKITNMQIYDAISRGIPKPTGDQYKDQEYRMFLEEMVLERKNKPSTTTIIEDKGKKKKPIIPVYGTWDDRDKRGKEDPIHNPDPSKKDPIVTGDVIGDKKGKEDPIHNPDPSKKDPIVDDKPTPDPDIDPLQKYLSEDLPDTLVKVVQIFKYNVLPLILAALMALPAISFKFTKSQTKEYIDKTQDLETVLEYMIKNTNDADEREVLRKKLEDIGIRIGDQVELENGQSFNTTSRMNGTSKTLGQEFNAENKFAGKYPITGFSMIRKSDNQILAYIEDFYSPTSNAKLSTFVLESLADNIDFDDIRLVCHFGRTDNQTGERSRLGWIEDGNVILNQDEIIKSIKDVLTYKATIENFKGDFITINTPEGPVQIPVKDAAGNFYKPGDKVVGSDNKVYEIELLDYIEETITKETVKEKKVPGSISFSIKNAKLAAALPFVMWAIIAYIMTKKKNEKAADNPYFTLVPNEELEEYIKTFQSNEPELFKDHEATLYGKGVFELMIIDGYYQVSGEKVEKIEDLRYYIEEGRIFVYKVDTPNNVIDITEYVKKQNGTTIGTGWDNNAEEYFSGRKGGM